MTLHAWLFVGLLVGMVAGYVHFKRSIWIAAALIALVPVILLALLGAPVDAGRESTLGLALIAWPVAAFAGYGLTAGCVLLGWLR